MGWLDVFPAAQKSSLEVATPEVKELAKIRGALRGGKR